MRNKADRSVLDFVINSFYKNLFRTNDVRMVEDYCELYGFFQLPRIGVFD